MIKKDKRLKQIAKEVRRRIVKMSHDSKVGHLGSALSIVDIMVVLYFSILKIVPCRPDYRNRDRFILSKGHAASALYAVLAKKGFFPASWLNDYCRDNGKLGTHPDHYHVPGVEWTTGSLGHGLSVGCGMALYAKRTKSIWKTYVLVSDAECQEGEVWEAALTAAQHQLNNLIVIIDYNQVQAFGKVKEIMHLEPFTKKWSSFGWKVIEVDGHNTKALFTAFTKAALSKNKPSVILAHTIRGKGVSFMEHKIDWYYNYPKNGDYQKAIDNLK